MFFPKLHGHPHSLHIHQVMDFFQTLMSHTGTFFNQPFIIFDSGHLVVTLNQKPVAAPSLIGKLNIKTKVPVINLFIINLAHVIPAGRHMPELNRLFLLIQNLKRCF